MDITLDENIGFLRKYGLLVFMDVLGNINNNFGKKKSER